MLIWLNFNNDRHFYETLNIRRENLNLRDGESNMAAIVTAELSFESVTHFLLCELIKTCRK